MRLTIQFGIVAFTTLGQCQVYQEIAYKNGDNYEGSVVNSMLGSDVRTGLGTYKWADGRVYEGMWKAGERHGKGVQVGPDGDRYEGGWTTGMRNGQGEHNFPNGEVYTRKFEIFEQSKLKKNHGSCDSAF